MRAAAAGTRPQAGRAASRSQLSGTCRPAGSFRRPARAQLARRRRRPSICGAGRPDTCRTCRAASAFFLLRHLRAPILVRARQLTPSARPPAGRLAAQSERRTQSGARQTFASRRLFALSLSLALCDKRRNQMTGYACLLALTRWPFEFGAEWKCNSSECLIAQYSHLNSSNFDAFSGRPVLLTRSESSAKGCVQTFRSPSQFKKHFSLSLLHMFRLALSIVGAETSRRQRQLPKGRANLNEAATPNDRLQVCVCLP